MMISNFATSEAANGKFHVALGDLPTWALFLGAFVAALIALRQLRIQSDDSTRQTRQLERQQANEVDFTWRSAKNVLIVTDPPGAVKSAGRTVVVVGNNSGRPIRNVNCWIELRQTSSRLEPIMVGPIGEPTGTSFEFNFYNPRAGGQYPLMRPKTKYGFLFEFEIPQDDAISMEPRPRRPMVQFMDDSDLIWNIDDDLRLQRVRAFVKPWHDVMARPD